MIADEAEAEGEAGLFGVAERGGDAGVGHGNDDVGGHAGLAGELAAHLVAALLHPSAVNLAVGAGEVDVLEDAAGLRNAGGVLAAGDAVVGDHDELAGKHVALVFGAEQVEGAGFRGEDDGVGAVGIADAAHGKRAEAARIAGREDAVAGHHHDGERAFDLGERVGDGVDQRCRHASGR